MIILFVCSPFIVLAIYVGFILYHFKDFDKDLNW